MRRTRWALLALLALPAAAMGGAALQRPERNEPILPLPAARVADARKVSLGEALFGDPRLSGGGKVSCSSCHDLGSNGATPRRRDVGDSGRVLTFNTPTVFNAAHRFRLNWEGKVPSVAALVESSLRHPDLMGAADDAVIERLARDAALAGQFGDVYGRTPDRAAVVEALGAYVASLRTPDSPFDRWLAGDPAAIGPQEARGYRLFRSIGCAACHQGANVGANLHQRHGIFAPLASPTPELLRVPSLRNVAVTAPYFHDGSTETLDQAVREMGRAQLDRDLEPADVDDIVAFLCSLTGRYRGEPLRPPAGSARNCAAAP